jgi:hypothetical protein
VPLAAAASGMHCQPAARRKSLVQRVVPAAELIAHTVRSFVRDEFVELI